MLNFWYGNCLYHCNMKNTMGRVNRRAKRHSQKYNTAEDRKQFRKRLDKYAEQQSQEQAEVRRGRKEDVQSSNELISPEDSDINKVEYDPKKAKRKGLKFTNKRKSKKK